ncbi:hypothetical protein K438DRAFT_1858903, partial [Mycena galopus ATCC 62051]
MRPHRWQSERSRSLLTGWWHSQDQTHQFSIAPPLATVWVHEITTIEFEIRAD